MFVFERHFPRGGGLVGVRRADHRQPGDEAQRHHVLHRLVGGAVLTHVDRIVREDVDHG